MHVRTVFLLGLILSSGFGGCLGGGKEGLSATPTPVSSSTSPTPTSAPAPTTTSAPAGNSIPEAELLVKDAEKTLEAENGTYVVSTATSLVFDASGSTDTDGDQLAFAWTVDDQPNATTASTLTATLTDGPHVVRVDVTDGKDTVGAEAQLQVGSAAPVFSGGDPALSYVLKGSFAAQADDTKAKLVPFDVPAGAKMITIWLTWNDDDTTSNSPMVDDLDLFLLGPDGKQVASAETSDFEFLNVTDDLAAGTWNAKILPYGDSLAGIGAPVGIPTAVDYKLDIIVWMVEPTVKVFKGTANGGANAGLGAPGTGTIKNDYEVLAGATTVTARLTWTNAGAAASGAVVRRTNDFDLNVLAGGKSQASSGNGFASEFAYKDAAAGATLDAGKWTFEIVPFEVTTSDWTLTVFVA